ncbi:MAG: hypothetical protein GY940_37070, partial [bacterium]|nr:hypothetical protein [bacterium]
NMLMTFPVGQETGRERLETIFETLIRRHESFRTGFYMIDEKPVQKVYTIDDISFSIPVIDVIDGAVTGEDYNEEMINSFSRPFDLSQPPLLRASLIQQKNNPALLLVEVHHIISDGVSQGILEKEFALLARGKEPAPLRLQYKDYSRWQNREAQQEVMRIQSRYWLETFSGELPVLNLPIDYPRPKVQRFEGKRLCFFIDSQNTQTLNRLSKRTDTTIYMILLSVFNILLSKISGLEDIIIGTTIAGRRHGHLEHIVGMFVNTLAMRNHPEGGKSFLVFLSEVKERTIKAYENQE